MHLTDLAIRSLAAPAAGQKVYYDNVLPSFGCRVSQGGTRSFVVRHGVDRRLITLGRYPVLSLASARQLARERLAEITLGKHRPRSIRWDDAVALYLSDCELKNRISTIAAYRRCLSRHFPFGRRRMSEITYEDVNNHLQRLLPLPGERNHALTAVRAFLNWAKKPPRRYIAFNPSEGITPSPRASRKRSLTDQELAAIYRTARARSNPFSRIVAVLVLTGQRRGETAALQWSWINRKERTITLPETISKNKTEHTFPYGDALASLLGVIPRADDLLFPAGREHVRGVPTGHFNGWTKCKHEFEQRCGITNWTLHDIRRSFATGLARLGVAPHVIERLLNHRLGAISNKTDNVLSAVADIYNRYTYLPEMRAAITLWEQKLATITALSLDQVRAPTEATVLPFHRPKKRG